MRNWGAWPKSAAHELGGTGRHQTQPCLLLHCRTDCWIARRRGGASRALKYVCSSLRPLLQLGDALRAIGMKRGRAGKAKTAKQGPQATEPLAGEEAQRLKALIESADGVHTLDSQDLLRALKTDRPCDAKSCKVGGGRTAAGSSPAIWQLYVSSSSQPAAGASGMR